MVVDDVWEFRTHKGGPHRVRCNGRRRSTEKRCGASITLGSKQPRGHSSPEKRKETKLALFLIRLGLSPTHANGFDLTTDFFARCRVNFGEQFRDYHAYRNAFLLKPGEYGLEDSTAVVLTDVLQVSLKRYGTGPARTQRLNVIVSVLRLKTKVEGEKKKKRPGSCSPRISAICQRCGPACPSRRDPNSRRWGAC